MLQQAGVVRHTQDIKRAPENSTRKTTVKEQEKLTIFLENPEESSKMRRSKIVKRKEGSLIQTSISPVDEQKALSTGFRSFIRNKGI